MQAAPDNRTPRKQQPSVVARLRALTPRRPLSFSEGVRIAEVQAIRLLQLSGWTDDVPVPESVVTDLPRLDVRRSSELEGSGVSVWHRGKWRIRVNAREPFTRQRFSLAHELKHVIDAAHEDVIYRQLRPGSAQRHTHIEAVCDAFAAALLMPKPWVKRSWYAGSQDLTVLAWRFQVSQQAMQIRLENLGLIGRQPRRYRTPSAYWVGRAAVHGRDRHYYRPSEPRTFRPPGSTSRSRATVRSVRHQPTPKESLYGVPAHT